MHYESFVTETVIDKGRFHLGHSVGFEWTTQLFEKIYTQLPNYNNFMLYEFH